MENDRNPPGVEINLRTSYKTGGMREFWRMQTEILMHPTPKYFRLAQNYARLGEKDEAQNCLEKAYENRDFDLAFVLVDPVFDEFHQDRRFVNLARLLLQLQD